MVIHYTFLCVCECCRSIFFYLLSYLINLGIERKYVWHKYPFHMLTFVYLRNLNFHKSKNKFMFCKAEVSIDFNVSEMGWDTKLRKLA